MKKILLFIAGLFLVGNTLSYDVIIYDNNNNLLFMYPVEEGTTEITLDGDWVKNGNNYTFNGGFTGLTVNYVDSYGNNKTLTTSNDIYLNGDYSIGYTGEQSLLLTDNSCGVYSGYTPVFDITGSIDSVTESGNIFNNFAENSLKVLLSNIPSYIQYVIMFILLLFILSIIRRFKRR